MIGQKKRRPKVKIIINGLHIGMCLFNILHVSCVGRMKVHEGYAMCDNELRNSVNFTSDLPA